jgi:predicted transposase YdaD
MFTEKDLEQTRFYQEAFNRGFEQGLQIGQEEASQLRDVQWQCGLIGRLLSLKRSARQISEAMNFERALVETVYQGHLQGKLSVAPNLLSLGLTLEKTAELIGLDLAVVQAEIAKFDPQ